MKKTCNPRESFLARLRDVKAAEFNTHQSPSFQGSQSLQATPSIYNLPGCLSPEVTGFANSASAASLDLLPPLGVQGVNGLLH